MRLAQPLSRLLIPLTLPVLLVLPGCQRDTQPAEQIRTVLVHVATGAPHRGVELTGEIRARHEIELAFRVGGKIAARLADTGSEIRAGQPLARLDPVDLQLAAAAADAQLAAAESELRHARTDFQRHADLRQRQFISQAAFEARQHALNAAEARVAQITAQNRISQNQATYGTLSSDFPAVISAVLADQGQLVAAGQGVFRVARLDEKEVQVAVPESQVGQFRQHRRFAVNLWSEPEITMTGELRELGAVADPQTRTFPARIRLLDPPDGVRLGMTARVVAQTPADAATGAALRVPLAAVGNQGAGAYVWVVADGRLSRRAVQIGEFGETGATIAGGLQAGETIVAAGIAQLHEGQAVNPRPLPPPSQLR